MLSAWNDVQRLSIDRDELLDFCVGGGEMHGGFWFSEYDDGEITEGPKLLSNGKGGKDYRIYIYIYIFFFFWDTYCVITEGPKLFFNLKPS